MNPSLLIIERPGSFRDALVSEIQLSGAQPHVRDDAMDALATLRELSPDLVLVAEDPGPPGASSVCRLVRRNFQRATVIRLGDPARLDLLDDQSPFVPRAIGAPAIARFLLQRAENQNAPSPGPHRAWDAPLGSLELGPLLTAIGQRWLTGRLVLSAQGSERELSFVRGMLVSARSSVFAERLGQVALRQGVLNQQQLEQALDVARISDKRLGEVLLDRGTLDAPKLFQLLCAQLVEQVAAACNNGACQARFVLDEGVIGSSLALRLHPVTAVLGAVRKTAKEDIGRVLDQLADRSVSTEDTPATVRSWLEALGVADVPQLLAAVTSVRTLREKLRERLHKVELADADADAITLALLRAGTMKLPGRASLVPADLRSGMTTLSPPSVASAVVRCARASFDGWPLTALHQAHSPLERALDAYLVGPSAKPAASAAALRGPGAEDCEVDPEILSLAIRAGGSHQRQPGSWLNQTPGAPAREVRLALHTLLARLDGFRDEPERRVERLRIAELRHSLGRALAALDSAAVLEEPSPADAPLAAAAKPAAASAQRMSREALEAIKDRSTVTHGGDPLLLAQVEPLVQQARWHELKQLLGGANDDISELSPAFTLLYAIALKEDASPGEASSPGPRADADALGIAAVSELLSIPPHSATALVIAKRALRRRPIEWSRKASGRASFFFALLALLLGAGIGLMFSPQLLQLFAR